VERKRLTAFRSPHSWQTIRRDHGTREFFNPQYQ
jgi:hypothetical protein